LSVAKSSDALLISRVQAGDEEAIGLIYDEHSMVVYSIALGVLSVTESAEDVLHETFMQLWREPASFALRGGSLKVSLAITALNRAIEVIGKESRARISSSVGSAIPSLNGDLAAFRRKVAANVGLDSSDRKEEKT